ncbi:hypothetical protein [Paenibacillus jilunlii]|uniref:Bla regulator protein blaR1 n=1 Tax=Paenibacillus jilunlii TaxID=682956 RepID=A0A1G9IPL2_9BACL|nr:hypothetical protein [Paenibacillus jilunlii]KWX72746.1 hypothetical protein AML91_20035 [Paenibacillus jilunlii]SDL27087.1 hypothetical protein SAMN05216191_102144 [Paenibacillus jilunlii]
MKFHKPVIALASLGLLLGSAYGSHAAAAASQSTTKSAAKGATAVPVASTKETTKKIQAQVDAIQLQKKNPGEIYYVYVNDKKVNPGGFSYRAFAYGLPFNNYQEYVQKAQVLKTPFLQLEQAPEDFQFQTAYLGVYTPQTWSIEGQKLSKQIVEEGKASGKTVFVKKMTDKRWSINLTYQGSPGSQQAGAFLSITAEPAGTPDPSIEYVPSLAEPEKLSVEGQDLTYKAGDALKYKTASSPVINNSPGEQRLEWIDSGTKISYTIIATGGEITKEALVSLAEQIITGQS